jgi:hypothetical protein
MMKSFVRETPTTLIMSIDFVCGILGILELVTTHAEYVRFTRDKTESRTKQD